MKSILILLLLPLLMFAQIKRMITIEGDMFEIPEIGGILVEDGENLRVDMAIPKDNRIKAYKDVDLNKGDLVLMMNGKKIDKVRKAKEIYDKLKPGEDVKLGIKRSEEMFIASFKKADPKDLPKVVRMVIRNDDSEFAVVLPDDGLLIGSDKEKVIVREKMQHSNNEIKEGDQLEELNGKKIHSTKDFSSIYKSLKTGDKLEMKFSSGKSLITKKPNNENKVIIKSEKK